MGPASDAYVPEACVWEITLACNMRCRHCGSRAGQARRHELSLDECLDVARQLRDLGCQRVTFIGGEVFLFKHWDVVAHWLSSCGILVNIITNGTLLGERQLEQIQRAGLANVGVSIDGLADTHDHIRNVPGAFATAMDGLSRLRELAIPTAAVTTLMAVNMDELDDLHAELAARGVGLWQLQIATAMGNMQDAADLLLDPDRVPDVIRFIVDKRREGRIWVYPGDDIGYFNEHEPGLRSVPGFESQWSGCQAGLRVVGIDSVGNVKGCESLCSETFIEGNLRQESLADIWYKEGNFAYNRQFDVSMLAGHCAGCDKGSVCRGGCRGACAFTSGHPFDNPYCCYPGRPGAQPYRAPGEAVTVGTGGAPAASPVSPPQGA